MKLAYAVLADFAQVTPDGKVSILGGDFDSIYALRFPAQHPNLALVMRFDVEQEECGYVHRLRIGIMAPLGAPLASPSTSGFTPQANPLDPKDRLVRAIIVVNIQNLEFPSQGTYQFQIAVDDQHKGTVPLYLKPLTLTDTPRPKRVVK